MKIAIILPNDAYAMAFTVVSGNNGITNTFTSCISPKDGKLIALTNDGTTKKPHFVMTEGVEQ